MARQQPDRNVGSTTAGKIALATSVPRENQSALRGALQEAVDYAWSVTERVSARVAAGDLEVAPDRIHRAATLLIEELDRASAGARSQIDRMLPIKLSVAECAKIVGHLAEAARAAPRRAGRTKERDVHHVTFLGKIDSAVVNAGGRHPTLNKNTGTGSLLDVLNALAGHLPHGFFRDSPATLAGWTKRIHQSRKHLQNRAADLSN